MGIETRDRKCFEVEKTKKQCIDNIAKNILRPAAVSINFSYKPNTTLISIPINHLETEEDKVAMIC